MQYLSLRVASCARARCEAAAAAPIAASRLNCRLVHGIAISPLSRISHLQMGAACGMLKAMPVSFEFLRGVLGLFGVACAYMVGRSFVLLRKGWEKPGRMYSWVLRMVLCLAAMAFRFPIDFADVMAWALAAVALSAAAWNASHEKPAEDLTSTIFPEDEGQKHE